MISNEHRPGATGGITRRTALRRVATGAGVTATTLWLNRLDLLAQDPAMHTHLAAATSAQAAAAPFVPKALTPAQLESVATLAELIIPTTNTPGARAALVDRFVDNIMANAQPADKERFLTGLAWMDTRSNALYAKPFTAATPEQQTELLTKLAAPSGQAAEDAPGVPFFTAIKGMTIAGYYSTKIGLEQELGDNGQLFNPVFEGCTHKEHQI
jgi:glucoside 3-dehydrogenase (cytochrome c) hitch-hiker subunit